MPSRAGGAHRLYVFWPRVWHAGCGNSYFVCVHCMHECASTRAISLVLQLAEAALSSTDSKSSAAIAVESVDDGKVLTIAGDAV